MFRSWHSTALYKISLNYKRRQKNVSNLWLKHLLQLCKFSNSEANQSSLFLSIGKYYLPHPSSSWSLNSLALLCQASHGGAIRMAPCIHTGTSDGCVSWLTHLEELRNGSHMICGSSCSFRSSCACGLIAVWGDITSWNNQTTTMQ